MAKTIAKVYGTALAPGVSRNGRFYTREVIARAVERAQSRLASGGLVVREMDEHPMAQRTHHAAEDDSTAIVGRVVSLKLADDGSALFEAHLADTPAGQTIAALVDTVDGPPFLRGVSIRGAWLGETYRTHHEGRLVETADDLEIDGLDYTHKPGVPGAVIDRVERTGAGPRETTPDGRTVIYESIQEVRVANAVEETTPAPAGAIQESAPPAEPVYADNGYRGEKRWPLRSLQETATAWSALHDPRTTADYSSRQLKRMRGRVRRALDEHGLTETAEGFLLRVDETTTEVTEGFLGGSRNGGFRICLNHGPLEVTVCAYDVDTQDLQLIARKAMAGATAALSSLDADDPFAREGGLPDDNQMESGGFVPFKKGQNSPADQKAGKGKPADDEDDDVEDGDETESGKFVPFKKGQNSPADQKKGAKPDDEDDDPKSKKDAKGKKPWESAGSAAVTETGAAHTTQEDPAVSETQNPGAAPAADPTTAAPAAVTLSAAQFAQLLAAAHAAPAAAPTGEAPVETAAPAASEVTETTDEKVARLVAEGLVAAGVKAPVQETEEQRIERLVKEGVQAALGQHVAQNGPPARKGLVESAGGHRGVHGGTVTQAAGVGGAAPEGFDRPLHTLSPEEWERTAGVAIERHVMGSRSVYAQG